jgi:2-hydroxycyclohexanecarboxyl-CoA dehydrogenase
MAGRVAFVTGGGGGIGGEAARRLAADGRAVAVADLDLDAARAVAEQITAAGGESLAVRLDVTDGASVDAAVATAVDGLGPVDILVNVAGWDRLVPFLDTDEAFWERVIDINYTGVLRTTRAVLPGMVERGWGRIVNTASDAGRVGSSLESVYSGAKGGVIAFTKTIAREVAKQGVTANTVCPGPTDTALLAAVGESLPDGGRKLVGALGRAVPMGRVATPADVAPAIVFFASDDAGFITGQTLSASGGLTMA